MTDFLIAQGKRKPGAAEALLAKTLRAWHEQGHLVGEEHASARGILRDAARAVDMARDDMYRGDGSAYSFARANELYRAALASMRPSEEVTDDGLDALLASLSAPPVRDGT